MRKMLMCAAVAAVLAGVSLSSMASDSNSQAFVNGSVGQSKFHAGGLQDNTDTGAAIYLGYRWSPEQRFWIGPELGFADLGKLSQNYHTDWGNGLMSDSHATIKNRAALLGVNMKWDLGEQMFLVVHGGVDRVRTSSDLRITSNFTDEISGSGHVSNNSWYAGATFGYDFNRSFGIGVTYDNYNLRSDSSFGDSSTNISVIGVTGEYRF